MTRHALMDRILALGLFLAVCVIFAFAALLPGLQAEAKAREETIRLSRLIAQADARAATLESDRAALTEARARRSSHPAWTQAADLALVTARIQTDLRDMVTGFNGVASQTRAADPTTDDGFMRQSVRIQFTGDDTVLRGLLYQIDYARPDLKLDNISLRILRTRDATQYLSMDMTVSALVADAGSVE